LGNLIGSLGDDQRCAADLHALANGLGSHPAGVKRDDRVERLLPAEGQAGQPDHQRVGEQIALAQRDGAPAHQQQRQNVGSAGGGLGAEDQPHADAADDAAEEGVQHDVIGDAAHAGPLKQRGDPTVDRHRDDGADEELPLAKIAHAEREQRQV